MLTDRYLSSVKNLPQVFEQMIKGTAPQGLQHRVPEQRWVY